MLGSRSPLRLAALALLVSALLGCSALEREQPRSTPPDAVTVGVGDVGVVDEPATPVAPAELEVPTDFCWQVDPSGVAAARGVEVYNQPQAGDPPQAVTCQAVTRDDRGRPRFDAENVGVDLRPVGADRAAGIEAGLDAAQVTELESLGFLERFEAPGWWGVGERLVFVRELPAFTSVVVEVTAVVGDLRMTVWAHDLAPPGTVDREVELSPVVDDLLRRAADVLGVTPASPG